MPKSPLDAKVQPTKTQGSSTDGQTVAGSQPTKSPISQYEEQQNDEIEVLRCVFPEDFEDIETKSTWSKKAEKSFQLNIRASSDPSYILALIVTFTATYPKTIPLIGVKGDEDLGPKTAAKVREVVMRRPQELLGEVMILDLANEMRDILEDAVEATVAGNALPSLGEERATEEARAGLELREAQKQAEQRRQAEKAEEERMMQQMVEEEAKRREVLRKKREADDGEGTLAPKYNAGDIVFDQDVKVNHTVSDQVDFRAVAIVRPLGQGPISNVFEVRPTGPATAPGTSLSTASSPMCFALKRTVLARTRVSKSILELEDELEKLKGLRNHNIIHVLDFKIWRQQDSWHFDILTELENTMSLTDLLETVERLPAYRSRTFGIDTLQGLDYYHKNNVVHGRLHTGNLLVCKSSTGNMTLKVADAGFQLRVHAMQAEEYSRSRSNAAALESPSAWELPECGPADRLTKSRKTDIFEFGIALAQMVLGVDVTGRFTTIQAFVNNAGLSSPFYDLVRDLLRTDPRKRPSAFDAIPYEFFRTECAGLEETKDRSQTSGGSRRRSFHHSNSIDEGIGSASASRYENDFDESGRLGKGGFGEVVRARNRLDGRVYAVKKISGKTPTQLSEVLSEVYLLATLNHHYVVRYYTAWPETETPASTEADSATASSNDSNLLQSRFTATGTGKTESMFVYGQSTGGIDFISSSGYPKVEFGGDDDEEGGGASDSEETEDDVFERNGSGDVLAEKDIAKMAASPLTRTRSLVRATLYIQMEFCERLTLRDIIRKGVHEKPEEVWRFLRQILEGLAHIHGHGIIHRDLKPENIFIDSSNNPKIGDFGLATTGNVHVVDSEDTSRVASGDMTRSIGTALYVAPELRSSVIGNYTVQVDMYSLGIILFEMCFPLRTAMERGQVIGNLRQKEHTLPQEFQTSSDKQSQGDIIRSLIKHKPSDRPSSIELLRGGKLPVQIEDEQIRHALSSLSDPSSPYYHRMMTALFAQNPNRQILDRMWDNDSSPITSTDAVAYSLLQSVVKERLLSVFRRYGAVEVSRQGLIPRSEYYSRGDVAQVLDASGTLVQLPYDLTLPLARTIARQDHVPERSFTFGMVFRESPSGGAPRNNREADFDIVSYTSKDLALAEAEIIKGVDDILNEFPCFTKTAMCFHISHTGLLDIILEHCRVSPSQWGAAKEVLGKLNIGPWTWQKIRTELRSPTINIASTSLDELAQFDFRDTSEKAFTRLQTLFAGTKHLPRVHAIFTHISGLFEYLKRFGLRRNVYFSPLSNFNGMFYRDAVMFQCLFDTKKRDILAAGGRYDSLIEDHRPSSLGSGYRPSLHGVGASIAWDRLVSAMARYQKQSGTAFLKQQEDPDTQGQWSTRRCEVLVASFDSAVLRSVGVSLVSKLRSHDISAELAIDTRAPEELLAHYRDDRHSWIIIIKHEADSSGRPDLKVRSMDKKGESTDIRSSELMSFMRAEIRDRDQRDGTNDRAKLLRHTSSHGGDTVHNERKGDVRVVTWKQGNKPGTKKPYRARVIEGAHARVKELLASYADGPIASIEVRDDVLMKIRETRLSDGDSWKRMYQEISVAERQYIHDVHDLLCQFKIQYGETAKKCFIYNFKTSMCIDYDLWL